MAELRLYAIGVDEVRGMFGCSPERAQHLREFAHQALAPAPVARSHTKLSKLGPLFRRPPAALVTSVTQPVPHDVEVLLAGAYVSPERTGASWRVLEILVQGTAWGSTSMHLSTQSMDDLDFALARGGVSSAVGLRHLLSSTTSVNLLPVEGLTVGWHPYEKVLAMAEAYRIALPGIESCERQGTVAALVRWLDLFVAWSDAAETLDRAAPDLVGFWAG